MRTVVLAGVALAIASGCSPKPISQAISDSGGPPLAVASVTVSLGSATVGVGQATQATATEKDAAGNTLSGRPTSYASSRTSVATVSSTGAISALAAGTTLITATSERVSGSATLLVSATPPAPVASVTVTLSPSSLTVGLSTQAAVTLKDASGNALTGRTVTYASSNTSVAMVSSSGTVTAMAAGSALITATSEGVSGSATLTVTVPPPPIPGFPNLPAGLTRILEHSFDQMPGTAGTGTNYTLGSWNNWTYANTTITDDPTAPQSPTRVLQVTWPTGLDDGERQGTGIDGRFGADYGEVYISIRFKILGTTFENQNVGTKLLGYVNYGGYERDNQFYWLLKERTWANGDGPGGIRTGPFFLESRVSYPYTQVYGTTAVRGVQYLANNQGVGNSILPGQWVHMEAYFKLNTKNADGTYNRDGIVKQWINGVLVQSYNNVDWLTPTTTSLGDHGFYGWHFDPIWGGNDGQIKTRDDNMYVDHIYIAGTKQ